MENVRIIFAGYPVIVEPGTLKTIFSGTIDQVIQQINSKKYVLQNRDIITPEYRAKLWDNDQIVPVFSFGGHLFLGNLEEATSKYKQTVNPQTFLPWLLDNYQELKAVEKP